MNRRTRMNAVALTAVAALGASSAACTPDDPAANPCGGQEKIEGGTRTSYLHRWVFKNCSDATQKRKVQFVLPSASGGASAPSTSECVVIPANQIRAIHEATTNSALPIYFGGSISC